MPRQEPSEEKRAENTQRAEQKIQEVAIASRPSNVKELETEIEDLFRRVPTKLFEHLQIGPPADPDSGTALLMNSFATADYRNALRLRSVIIEAYGEDFWDTLVAKKIAARDFFDQNPKLCRAELRRNPITGNLERPQMFESYRDAMRAVDDAGPERRAYHKLHPLDRSRFPKPSRSYAAKEVTSSPAPPPKAAGQSTTGTVNMNLVFGMPGGTILHKKPLTDAELRQLRAMVRATAGPNGPTEEPMIQALDDHFFDVYPAARKLGPGGVARHPGLVAAYLRAAKKGKQAVLAARASNDEGLDETSRFEGSDSDSSDTLGRSDDDDEPSPVKPSFKKAAPKKVASSRVSKPTKAARKASPNLNPVSNAKTKKAKQVQIVDPVTPTRQTGSAALPRTPAAPKKAAPAKSTLTRAPTTPTTPVAQTTRGSSKTSGGLRRSSRISVRAANDDRSEPPSVSRQS